MLHIKARGKLEEYFKALRPASEKTDSAFFDPHWGTKILVSMAYLGEESGAKARKAGKGQRENLLLRSSLWGSCFLGSNTRKSSYKH